MEISDLERELTVDAIQHFVDTNPQALKGEFAKPPISTEHLAVKYCEEQQKKAWEIHEIVFSRDKFDIHKVSPEELQLIKNTLAFFAGSDKIVGDFLETLLETCEVPELIEHVPYLRMWLSLCLNMELRVHQHAYGLQIDAIAENEAELETLSEAIVNNDVVKFKAGFVSRLRQLNQDSIDEPLMRFLKTWLSQSVIESIFFAGSFLVIYHFVTGRSTGAIPKDDKITYDSRGRVSTPHVCFAGIGQANNYISQDEKAHYEFPLEFINLLKKEGTISAVQFDTLVAFYKRLLELAIDAEMVFMNSILKGVVGLTPINVHKYLQYVADSVFVLLTGKRLFGVENPYGFMDWLYLAPKMTSPLEERPVEYNADVSSLSEKSDLTKIDFT